MKTLQTVLLLVIKLLVMSEDQTKMIRTILMVQDGIGIMNMGGYGMKIQGLVTVQMQIQTEY